MRAERGFTLLEVLVAFVVLSTTLAAGYQAISSGAKAGARAAERLEATSRLETALALAGEATVPRPGRRTTTDGPWTIEVEVSPLADTDRRIWREVGVAPYRVEAIARLNGVETASLTATRLGPPR